MPTRRAPTAEEAMLYAALTGDQETLDRLASDTYPGERRTLVEAMNRVRAALESVEEHND